MGGEVDGLKDALGSQQFCTNKLRRAQEQVANEMIKTKLSRCLVARCYAITMDNIQCHPINAV
jgi:hypothetical protein